MSSSASEEAKFCSHRIIKSACLGKGAYGLVYKARCDDLLCAAKIMHPDLQLLGDHPAVPREELHRLPMQRFESECRFMSAIRHPNIVQYLGTCQDPETSLPVLLMELMDQNLTSFLEECDSSLPFHTQVHICHDISLALSFLHSNKIYHRDLSSNNVLMIGDRRAKVTDFGMARLFSCEESLTENPGTIAYMPPEALGDIPSYNINIDCFSFGVLAIQVMTLLFPKPGERFAQIQGGKNLHAKVPEKIRRQNHIELVESGHPLLSLALDCIEESSQRPSAQEICRRLQEMTDSERYSESVRLSDLVRVNRELNEQAKASKQQHAAEVMSLESRHSVDIEDLREQCRIDMQDLEALHAQEVSELQAHHKKDMDYLHQVNSSMDQWTKSLQHNHSHEIVELKQSHTLQLKSVKDDTKKWQQKYEQAAHEDDVNIKPTREDLEGQVKTKSDGAVAHSKKNSALVINWSLRDKQAPQAVYREDSESVFCNDTLYIRSASRRSIFAYQPRLDEWKELSSCPHKYSTLAHMNSTVLVLGGRTDDMKYLNKICYLTGGGRWEEAGFRMPTKRCSAMVVTAGTYLVVAGGEGEESRLRKVEVMDIPTHTWFTATDLPEALIFSSAALHGGELYLLGGEVGYNGVEKHCLFTCCLEDLLKSRARTPREKKRRTSEPPINVWRQFPGAPVTRSACVAFQGCILSIGGRGSDRKPTSAVYAFDVDTRSWKQVSYMAMTRSKCFAVVLPGDEIRHEDEVLVVGGRSSSGKTDTLELGTVLL